MIENQWKPGESPDPSAILAEADADADAGRFELSLAKHRWFFHHALELASGLYGVRLSFALSSWRHLGESYPPAMDALRAERDQSTQNTIDGIDVFESFHDASSINRVLDDAASTRDLFLHLHNTNSTSAERVYHVAQPVLITYGEYDICNRYLQADTAIDQIIQTFQFDMEFPYEASRADRHRKLIEKNFRNESASDIALLVVGEQMEEAQMLARKILAERDDALTLDTIDRALQGQFPPQRS